MADRMKFVIAGGTGQVGRILSRAFRGSGHRVVVLSRGSHSPPDVVSWDARTQGTWEAEIDGADVVINLAGRSVDCRYTRANLELMMRSRVESTTAVGEAVAGAARPPGVWLQMSTATIYAHRYDSANDEVNGIVGGSEPGVPAYWKYSIDIAQAWERALDEAATPSTRKVALRTAMVMSPDRGGIFDVLVRMTRFGLGGAVGDGRQFVSWIHERDFVGAIEFLVRREDLSGPVNLAAPDPLPQREFMAGLRAAWGTGVGLPATAWMAELGAFVLRTDTELLLKSRRVAPRRLVEAGFDFDFGRWEDAARELVGRYRSGSS